MEISGIILLTNVNVKINKKYKLKKNDFKIEY